MVLLPCPYNFPGDLPPDFEYHQAGGSGYVGTQSAATVRARSDVKSHYSTSFLIHEVRRALWRMDATGLLPARRRQNRQGYRAYERTRTADLISLRVCGQWLLSIARVCHSRIDKGFLVPAIAHTAGHCVWVRVKRGSTAATCDDVNLPHSSALSHPLTELHNSRSDPL